MSALRATLFFTSLCLTTLLGAATLPSHATAQTDCRELPTPAAGDTTSAQRTAIEAFSRGSRATDEERWDSAERCFRMAWELSHVALARYNQAVALRALGRSLDARDAFDSALEAGLDPDRTAQATTMRAEVAANVATLSIEGITVEGAEIELDGDPVPRDAAAATRVECDPGRHTLIVRATGYTPFTWSGDVVSGTTAPVAVALDPLPSGGGAGVLEEPWFWVVVGAVLAGVGIGVGVYAQDQAQLRGEAAPGFVVRL